MIGDLRRRQFGQVLVERVRHKPRALFAERRAQIAQHLRRRHKHKPLEFLLRGALLDIIG